MIPLVLPTMEQHLMKEEQIVFEFARYEKACRYCVYLFVTLNDEKGCEFTCGVGEFKGGKSVLQMHSHCVMFKKGREKMSYVDLRKLSEEQLRLELEKIRAGRVGMGRKKRGESRERRISDVRKGKVVKEGAERINITLD